MSPTPPAHRRRGRRPITVTTAPKKRRSIRIRSCNKPRPPTPVRISRRTTVAARKSTGAAYQARQRKKAIAQYTNSNKKQQVKKALAAIKYPLDGEVYVHLPPGAMDIPLDKLMRSSIWTKAVAKYYAAAKTELEKQYNIH
jgi:hypothetical protein